jgi:hypothetical protein
MVLSTALVSQSIIAYLRIAIWLGFHLYKKKLQLIIETRLLNISTLNNKWVIGSNLQLPKCNAIS